ncbi:hypothetical protein H8356DRAFT_1028308 [Neocallimastix lanati (nom. inval.)]|jgi:predicted secreted protein|uniref:Proteinase inhibitor I42 chagasin domain-containing protein n=1 Tax=Neocallimastix californiae TaxID=1754190 RepID=A0A1Y2ASP3_9FUNG|nr:hypothetical protein H8356DRAFT_1028308 [Neocallimastix sp. JGI-2020a]ORY25589.1 hypothetical protein LY90DRAFT_674821 [Neocallimastix californiae]|eukprot:ORY25589.1 hypothetical protein LY90DRAFT_674821 [Neocallimastix californiae]
MVDTNEPSLKILEQGGNFDLDVNENSSFNIILNGNPTTGYSWFLENVDELRASNIIEPINLDEHNGSKNYISDANKNAMCGVGGVFVFKFKANKANRKEIPKLSFIYKRPWESGDPDFKAVITLKIKESNQISNEVILPQNASQGEIKINEGELFSIKLKGNPTTGYSWFLINDEEIANAGIIPLNLGENKSGSYISHNPKGMVGGGGIFDFQFKASKVTNNLPSIKFTYRRPWEPVNDNDRKLEVTLIN